MAQFPFADLPALIAKADSARARAAAEVEISSRVALYAEAEDARVRVQRAERLARKRRREARKKSAE